MVTLEIKQRAVRLVDNAARNHDILWNLMSDGTRQLLVDALAGDLHRDAEHAWKIKQSQLKTQRG